MTWNTSKKIKVVHLISTLAEGGVERTLLACLPEFDTDRYEISVCCTYKPGRLADLMSKKGIPVSFCRVRSRFHPLDLTRLARYLKEQKTDIVHTHMYSSGISGLVAARWAGVPVVFSHFHNLHEWKSRNRILTASLILKKSDGILTASEKIGDYLSLILKFERGRIQTVYNGIETERFKIGQNVDNLKKELGITENDLVVGMLGRMVKHKGHRYLIEAAHKIITQDPRVKFVLVGGGELFSSLQKLVKEKKLESQVIFTGHQDNVIPFISIFDLSVLPSVSEGLGVAAIESSAMEKPIIVAGTGGLPEVVDHQVSGIIVPPEDPGGLSDAVLELIGDSRKRKEMGKAGRKKVLKQFTGEAMVSKLSALYSDAWGLKR